MLIAATLYRQRLTSFWNSDAGLVMRFAAIALVFPAIAFVALVVHFKGLADFEAGRSTKPATFQDRWPRAPFGHASAVRFGSNAEQIQCSKLT
jgi:hypothetical protein